MLTSSFSTPPSWLLQPEALKNVFINQFSSLKNVPSFVDILDFPPFFNGLKQALYWRRRLASSVSANTVIFSLLGEKGLVVPNILEVCQALRSVCDMTQLIEVYHAPNSSFIGISFSNSSEASIFRSLFTYYNNSIVVHVAPSSSLIHQFKLIWLPPLFPDTRIHHFLSKHSIHHNFSRICISTDDNVSTPSNSVTGTIELSPHQDVTKIPHLIPLPSPHLGSALLIISGRQPLCLKCGSTGHTRRTCPSSRCVLCHCFHLPSSSCSSITAFPDSPDFNPWLADDASLAIDHIATTPSPIVHPQCDPTHDESALVSPSVAALITPLSLHSSPDSSPTQVSATVPNSAFTVVKHSPSTKKSIPSAKKSTPSAKKSTPSAKKSTPSAKKSTLSTKQLCSVSYLSTSLSRAHDLSFTNIFSHLADEASSIITDSSLHISDQLSDVLPTSTAPSVPFVVAKTLVPAADVNFEASGSTSAPFLHKRAKLHSTDILSSPSLPPHISAPLFVAPASLWGDRMEEEFAVPAIPAPSLSSSSFPSLPSKYLVQPSSTASNPSIVAQAVSTSIPVVAPVSADQCSHSLILASSSTTLSSTSVTAPSALVLLASSDPASDHISTSSGDSLKKRIYIKKSNKK